jgi:endonuclease-8
MPEGPEVRNAADQIERVLVNKVLTEVHLYYEPLISSHHLLQGYQLLNVQTFGKAFVLYFSSEICIYVHLQLYGVWRTGKNTPKKKNTLQRVKGKNRSIRMRLKSETHYVELYSATDVSVWPTDIILKHPFIRKLGPDLLSGTYKAHHISRRLNHSKYKRRQLGHVLLDQQFFAGLGNYLRSEILFVSQLHPKRTLGSLSIKERRRLSSQIYTIIYRAYKNRGITTSSEYVEKKKELGWSKPSYRHYVFGRVNKGCPICNTKILKIDFSGRRLYLCLTCQTE